MNRQKREELYDNICCVLTDYEHPQDAGLTECEAAIEMYCVLVEVQNKWDDLMSEGD